MLKAAKSAEDPTQAKREHALIRVTADAGLRVSEAVNLKADDVCLAGGKWCLLVRGKGDKSRDVEVSEDLAQELLALKVADFTASDQRVKAIVMPTSASTPDEAPHPSKGEMHSDSLGRPVKIQSTTFTSRSSDCPNVAHSIRLALSVVVFL